MRVVLDVNVLISARLEPRGPSARLLQAWIEERFELIVSPQLLAELDEVLHRDRLRRWLSEEDANLFVASLRADATLREDPADPPGLTPDPDDDYLLALAQATGADYLVSGDRHLTELSEPRPPVLTPRELLDRIETQQ